MTFHNRQYLRSDKNSTTTVVKSPQTNVAYDDNGI